MEEGMEEHEAESDELSERWCEAAEEEAAAVEEAIAAATRIAALDDSSMLHSGRISPPHCLGDRELGLGDRELGGGGDDDGIDEPLRPQTAEEVARRRAEDRKANHDAHALHRVVSAAIVLASEHLSADYFDATKDRLYCGAVAGDDRRAVQTVLHATLDVLLLAECDAFAGKFTSNLFRNAYSLKAASCDCAAPFISLDAPWCFDYGLQVGQNLKLRDAPNRGRFWC